MMLRDFSLQTSDLTPQPIELAGIEPASSV